MLEFTLEYSCTRLYTVRQRCKTCTTAAAGNGTHHVSLSSQVNKSSVLVDCCSSGGCGEGGNCGGGGGFGGRGGAPFCARYSASVGFRFASASRAASLRRARSFACSCSDITLGTQPHVQFGAVLWVPGIKLESDQFIALPSVQRDRVCERRLGRLPKLLLSQQAKHPTPFGTSHLSSVDRQQHTHTRRSSFLVAQHTLSPIPDSRRLRDAAIIVLQRVDPARRRQRRQDLGQAHHHAHDRTHPRRVRAYEVDEL